MNELSASFYLFVGLAVVAAIALSLLLRDKDKTEPLPANSTDPQAWELGPIYAGVNVSTGANVYPTDGGWCIDIPLVGAGSVHYVTMPTGSLLGKTKVSLVCEFVMAPGVKLCPVKSPEAPSLLTLYFQRKGDNWSGVEQYQTYRWYASFATEVDLSAGEYTIEARFDDNWTGVQNSSRATHPEEFADALANACRIGFVLGGGDGLGHGASATGDAKLIIKSFEVE